MAAGLASCRPDRSGAYLCPHYPASLYAGCIRCAIPAAVWLGARRNPDGNPVQYGTRRILCADGRCHGAQVRTSSHHPPRARRHGSVVSDCGREYRDAVAALSLLRIDVRSGSRRGRRRLEHTPFGPVREIARTGAWPWTFWNRPMCSLDAADCGIRHRALWLARGLHPPRSIHGAHCLTGLLCSVAGRGHRQR